MNSFALLQDDVEDADDLAPAPKPVVAPPAPPAHQKPVVSPAPLAARKPERPRWRENENDFRGGRQRGRGRGGRGMRGRGGYRGRGRGGGGNWNSRFDWDAPRFDREWGEPKKEVPLAPLVEEVPVPVEHKEPVDTAEDLAAGIDEQPTVEGGEDVEDQVKEMTLDEYMAEKKAKALELRSLSSKSTRKPNAVGGKMAVFKRADSQQHAETSIMSAVSMKQAVEERSTKDSTHAAVADNAKNQQFFKNGPRDRPFRGRGRGGYRGGRGRGVRRFDDRYNDHHASYSSSPEPAAPSINVDDTNAFPALNANA